MSQLKGGLRGVRQQSRLQEVQQLRRKSYSVVQPLPGTKASLSIHVKGTSVPSARRLPRAVPTRPPLPTKENFPLMATPQHQRQQPPLEADERRRIAAIPEVTTAAEVERRMPALVWCRVPCAGVVRARSPVVSVTRNRREPAVLSTELRFPVKRPSYPQRRLPDPPLGGEGKATPPGYSSWMP